MSPHKARQSSSGRAAGFTRRSKKLQKPLNAANITRIASRRIPGWWLDEYFGPLERFAERIHEDGTVDVSVSGMPLLSLPDGRLYYPVAEMCAMAEVFRIAQLRDVSCPSREVLLGVASKLTNETLLTLEDVLGLRHCIQELRAFAARQSRNSMIDLIRTTRIKLEMERREASAETGPVTLNWSLNDSRPAQQNTSET